MTYLVLGATGKTGRHVVSQLTDRGAEVRPASRATGFDWTRPSTWDSFLDGATGAYIVETTEDPALPAAFAKRAVAAGVGRLVLLSARLTHPVQVELIEERERGVIESGAEWAVLRPAWFTQNLAELPWFTEPMDATGALALPTGEGREAFIDARDIAAVAARVLTDEPGAHHGRTYTLSGPRLLGFDDVAAELGRALGREIGYRPVSDEAKREALLGYGVPGWIVDMVEEYARAYASGWGRYRTDTVEQLLGRPPRDLAEFARDHAGAFAA